MPPVAQSSTGDPLNPRLISLGGRDDLQGGANMAALAWYSWYCHGGFPWDWRSLTAQWTATMCDVAVSTLVI